MLQPESYRVKIIISSFSRFHLNTFLVLILIYIPNYSPINTNFYRNSFRIFQPRTYSRYHPNHSYVQFLYDRVRSLLICCGDLLQKNLLDIFRSNPTTSLCLAWFLSNVNSLCQAKYLVSFSSSALFIS